MRVLFIAQDSKLFHIGRLAESVRRHGATTQVVQFSRYAQLTGRITLMPSPKLLTRIFRFRPDVVFTDIYHWDSWVSRIAGYPILVHMRGDFWGEFAYLYYTRTKSKSLPSKLATMWIRFVMERGIDFAHTVMPICNWLAAQVRIHRPGKRIKILYQPIEPEIWKKVEGEKGIALRHPSVISVFDFNILPKVLGFIRFLDVARALPNVNFYVAGSGHYLEHVLSRNPPGNVTFMGRLAYPKGVKALLREGDLFVHPSGQDACPLTVMEAQLMEKATIATDVGGIPEVMCDKRFLVKDGDTGDWIAKIQDLLDHPNDRETIGVRNRGFIEENFSMDKISKELLEYIRAVTR